MQKAICDASFTGHRTYLKLASVQEKQSNAILLASEVRCRKTGSIHPYRFTVLPTRMSS
jgi:hypothetical protein